MDPVVINDLERDFSVVFLDTLKKLYHNSLTEFKEKLFVV